MEYQQQKYEKFPVETKLCTVHDTNELLIFLLTLICITFRMTHDVFSWCLTTLGMATMPFSLVVQVYCLYQVLHDIWCMTCFLLCSTYNPTTRVVARQLTTNYTPQVRLGVKLTRVFVSVFKYANLHFNIIKDPVFVGHIRTFDEIHTKYRNMHNLMDFISFFNNFKGVTKLPPFSFTRRSAKFNTSSTFVF